MIRRPLLAALAAVSLAACGGKPSSGPRTVLVEHEGRYAIAVQQGKTIEFFPLPRNASMMLLDGTTTPLSSTVQLGPITKCPCSVPDCSIYCMPKSAWWDVDVLTLDPRTQTGTPPGVPTGPPTGPPTGTPPAP